MHIDTGEMTGAFRGGGTPLNNRHYPDTIYNASVSAHIYIRALLPRITVWWSVVPCEITVRYRGRWLPHENYRAWWSVTVQKVPFVTERGGWLPRGNGRGGPLIPPKKYHALLLCMVAGCQ